MTRVAAAFMQSVAVKYGGERGREPRRGDLETAGRTDKANEFAV
jgi:hypothetical protein